MTRFRGKIENIPVTAFTSAGFPIIWVQTPENRRTMYDYAVLLLTADRPFSVYTWDITSGISQLSFQDGSLKSKMVELTDDPLKPIQKMESFPERTVMFLHNFHRFLKEEGAIEVVQILSNEAYAWKDMFKSVIILSPSVDIPAELEKAVVVLDYDLPGREKIAEIARDILSRTKNGEAERTDGDMEEILDAATGLSGFEAENAFALSLGISKKIDPAVVREIKAQMVRKSSMLEIYRGDDAFDKIGGLENLKDFCKRAVASPLSRGVLLLGVPGTGKSAFAKALGNETGRQTLSMNPSRFYAGIVGASENNVRMAFKTVDRMEPAILFIDEIERAFSGAASSHLSDGGVGSRIMGNTLSWLNDHTSRVFVVATCNDLSKLPAEFQRAERWDAIFFVDLPNKAERDAIFKIYSEEYDISKDQEVPDLKGWTGAEIKSICRQANMLKCSLADAKKYIVPLSTASSDRIGELRLWAKGRTVPASSSNEEEDISMEIQEKKDRHVSGIEVA